MEIDWIGPELYKFFPMLDPRLKGENVAAVSIEIEGPPLKILCTGDSNGVPDITLYPLKEGQKAGDAVTLSFPEYSGWYIWSYTLYQFRTLHICFVRKHC